MKLLGKIQFFAKGRPPYGRQELHFDEDQSAASVPPFQKVGELWSARIDDNHRALALESADGLDWIWIGSHAEYDRLIK